MEFYLTMDINSQCERVIERLERARLKSWNSTITIILPLFYVVDGLLKLHQEKCLIKEYIQIFNLYSTKKNVRSNNVIRQSLDNSFWFPFFHLP